MKINIKKRETYTFDIELSNGFRVKENSWATIFIIVANEHVYFLTIYPDKDLNFYQVSDIEKAEHFHYDIMNSIEVEKCEFEKLLEEKAPEYIKSSIKELTNGL